MEFLSKSPSQTHEIAEKLARRLAHKKSKKATVIGLEGELGAGKTVFVKGFAAALGIKKGIRSPTFNLMKCYAVKAIRHKPYAISHLYHLDCYRLNSGKDLKPLGFSEIIANPANIVLIEWAERVADALPRRHITVHIDHMDKNSRRIFISQ